MTAERVGSHRVAVVMGTSEIAEGEAAIAQRIAKGIWPKNFRARSQEIGNLAGFVSDYFGARRPRLHDIDGMFLERESFCLGPAAYRSGSTRRRRRDRWSGHAYVAWH
jgi:hypothetical protein